MALPTSLDKIPELTGSAIAPAWDAQPVTPSDSTVQCFKALYIGGTGNVALVTGKGTTITFTAVPVGILPVSGTKVMSTNTTATNIIGLV